MPPAARSALLYPPVSVDDLAAIEAEWQRVAGAWDEPAAHRRFLVLCQSLGRLDQAGRRYREVRDREPERRADAERRLDEILALAMQSLAALKTEPPPKRPLWLVLLAALVGGAIVVVSLVLLLRAA